MGKTNASRYLAAREKGKRSLIRKLLKLVEYIPPVGVFRVMRFPDRSCLYWHIAKGDIFEAPDLESAERFHVESNLR